MMQAILNELQLLADRAVAKAVSNLFDKENSNNFQNLLKSLQVRPEQDEFYTVKETQAFTKLSRTSIYNLSKTNPHFPKPKRLGRRIVYSKKELIDFLNRIQNYKREPP